MPIIIYIFIFGKFIHYTNYAVWLNIEYHVRITNNTGNILSQSKQGEVQWTCDLYSDVGAYMWNTDESVD